MDAKSIIKTYQCKNHPKEAIQRVCAEIGCETSLLCIECILSSHSGTHKESLSTISEFVEKASKHYESLRRIKCAEDAPPTEFTDFLSREDENLAKLSQHIEKEKLLVDQAVTEILNEFTLLCHKTKEEIFKNLDNQVGNLKANYKYYRGKLNKFYSKNDEDSLNPSKDDLLDQLNRTSRLEEFEYIVKNIKDDMAEAKLTEGSFDQKITQIKNSIKEMADTLKTQSTGLPRVNFTVESSFEELIKGHKEINLPYFDDAFYLQNNIIEFNMANIVIIDSKILKSFEQATLLKKWISNGSVKFKLLYRGTRDGFTSTSFHKKCDKAKPTLTLVHNDQNKIFGGFTDQDWTITSNYKVTENAFLFSVTEKEKYPLKSGGSTYASYAYSNYMPTFGGGHDLYLCENCNTSNANYANFNYSYDSHGKSRETLTGAYNFTVKELEIFQVDFTGDLLLGNGKKGVIKGMKKLLS